MKLLNEVIETFERLSAVYDELLETAKAKQRHLVSGNIEGLETLLYQERNQIEIAQLLEEKRRNVLDRYCKEYDLLGDKITMKSLVNGMGNVHSEKIGALLNRLTQTIKQLQDVNETNATLTHYSLEITEGILKIFYPSDFQYPIYQHTGKIQGSELSRVLIDTEI